ncbi:MAG: transglutaminase domain-containing protein [Candidatus Binatia bacterium]
MRLSIRHQTTYRYDEPAEYAAQILRMTPREYGGLRVVRWNVTTTGPGRLSKFEDGFGNFSHVHTVVDMHDTLAVEVDGEVETTDTLGVVRGGSEPLPLGVYLRSTPLTFPSDTIAALAARAATESSTRAVLHLLMQLVAECVQYRPGSTSVVTTAAEALAGGSGVCQDQAHVFIAAARVLGIPTRYVGGYLCLDGDGFLSRMSPGDEAGHAWAEAFDAESGWTGFDPTSGTVSGPWHVRTSIGLDYESASPVRGIRRGQGGEVLEVGVQVARLGEQ